MPKTVKKKKNPRGKKLRRSLILFILLIIAVIYVCLFTPLFGVRSISVTGHEQVTAEEITDRSGIVMGTNLFQISKSQIEQNLLSIPYLETVRVSRVIPSRVRIEVTETHAVLAFPFTTGYVITNENGKVLELVPSLDGWSLPVITGVSINSADISQKMSVQDEVQFDIIIENIKTLMSHELFSQIKEIDFQDLSNVVIYLQSGLKVIFGQLDNIDYKIAMLGAILPHVDQSEGSYVDLTTEKAFSGRLLPSATPVPSGSPDSSQSPLPDSGASGTDSDDQAQEDTEIDDLPSPTGSVSSAEPTVAPTPDADENEDGNLEE